MDEPLDDLLRRLASEPGDHPPPGLEARVLAGVARLQRERSADRALAPFRVGAVAAAMVIGVAAGGLAAAKAIVPQPMGTFSPAPELAPSTLLGGTR